MSQSVTDFFKKVGSTPLSMNSGKKKKLSLNRKPSTTPSKTPKSSIKHASPCNVIDLISDDEDLFPSLDLPSNNKSNSSNRSNDEVSNSSASTIIYTPETPRKVLSPVSVSSRSPSSKFFSPVKKRNIKLRTPTKVKKNLFNISGTDGEDEGFTDACDGYDDKTIFLLKIINKYLKDDELKPLLVAKSQDLLSKCIQARKPGMRLVCRLYWRRPCWYRMDMIKQICSEKKKYALDDPTVIDMINCLAQSGLVESANTGDSKCNLELEDHLSLLKLDELKQICKDLKLKISNKQDAIKCLRSFSRQKYNMSNFLIGGKSDNASRLLNMLNSKTGPCYRLTEALRETMDELYLLMYLGIDYNILREKKLELTLLYDKINRECYPVDKNMRVDTASVVFKTREEFERYLNARNIYENFLATTDLKEKCSIVENVYTLYKGINKELMLSYISLPPWLQRFTPAHLYVKILEDGIQELKKSKQDDHITLALEILATLMSQSTFRQHRKAEWYAEKALILDKFKFKPDEAAQILIDGFSSKISEVAMDCMRPRALKIANRQTNAVSSQLKELLIHHATKDAIMEKNLPAKHIYKIPMDTHQNRGKIKFETRTADGRVVQEAEEFCISHYISEGKYTHGGHWEGRIVTTIFFLLFWDIIYADLRGVRGVYLTHYQVYPMDLFLDSFYVNRKSLIEERLKEIEESPIEDVVERMSQTWESRPETELSGITRSVGWESVSGVSRCVRARALAALCRRLARDYRHAHSGFPDLTLWNDTTRQIKFVEVKTDSDKPSMKQIQWMHYLQENGIETEFCYVGVNTTRCKARNS